ncbi:MAG TPA: FTR1 family protein [Candidatus Acidoferrum sp.]|nr:FTR1 family protein [Candidatus Acidoferrum sp.]
MDPSTALIVFREVLEAALVVGIVMAGSKGAPGRGLWVGSGILAGVAGACVVAAFAGVIQNAAAGIGQELLNAGILFAAVAMLGWHCIWMGRHGREIAQHVSAVSRAVVAGSRPLYALGIVVGLAVLREGSEVVLFLYGIAAGGGAGASAMLGGGAVGLAGGAAVGVAIYAGLMRIPMRYLFAVTTWMIILLAAGMASQGAGFLVQADLLPALGRTLWDTSGILSERGVLGRVLHTLVGYDAKPSGIQLLFYATTLLIIGSLTWILGKANPPAAPAARAA